MSPPTCKQMASYAQIPTSDPDSSFPIFDYTSPFNFTSINTNYRSIFTYRQSVNDDALLTPDRKINLTERCFTQLILFIAYVFVVLTAPISLFFVMKKIPQYERIIVFRFGRLQPIKGPGTVFVLPLIDRYKLIDLRMRAFIIPPQNLILSDDAIVEIGAEIRFRIRNIENVTLQVKDLDDCLRVLGRSLLVNNLSKKCLPDLQTDKNGLQNELLEIFNCQVTKWGIEVVQIDFTSINILQQGQTHPALNRLLGALTNSLQPEKKNSPSLPLVTEMKTEDPILNCLERIIESSRHSNHLQDIRATFSLQVKRTNDTIINYNLSVQDGVFHLLKNVTNPDVTITASHDDLLKILNLQLSPIDAYLSNKIKVSGEMRLVTSLSSALKINV